MGQKDTLSIIVKAALKENQTEKIQEQIKKLEEKLKPITQKIEISEEAIKSIWNSCKTILDNNKGVDNKLIVAKAPNLQTSKQHDKLFKKYSVNDIIKFILFGAAYLSTAYAIRRFADLIEEISEKDKEVIRALTLLSEAGFAPNNEISITFIKAINECECIENVRKQRKIIAQLTVDHYDERILRKMLSQWNEHLLVKKRIKILESAIEAHVQKKYSLSIPVLLAQIEGIVMDGFYHVGDYMHERVGIYLKDLIAIQKNKSLCENIYTNLYKNIMMVTFKKGIKEYSKSRHSILHGASYRYGKADYSLKLILFLDMIIKMFNYCSYGSDSKYHVVGCKFLKGRILRTSKDRPFKNNYFNKKTGCYIEKLITFYQSKDEAKNAGKTPCSKCIIMANN